MITLTEQAREELERFFEGKERTAVRIHMVPFGCEGSRLALAAENPTDEDVVYEVGGFTFCMTKNLEETVGDVDISLMFMGFIVNSSKPLPESHNCIGCSGACGTRPPQE